MSKDWHEKLHRRDNKNYSTYYTRFYNPKTKSNKTLVLGRITESFTNEEAIKKLNYIMNSLEESNYQIDVEDILLDYETLSITVAHDKDKSFEQVAEMYFDKKYEDMEDDYYLRYRILHKLKDKEDLKIDPHFKSKVRSFKTYKNNYVNSFLVEEWNYRQDYIKRKKDSKGNPIPKKELTKISIKSKTSISQKKIYNIKDFEIENWIKKIKNRVDISDKTKYNIITLIATIFNWAKRKKYIKESPFLYIEPTSKQKNPKNVRERILTVQENELLFDKLYQREGLNSFHASLLLLATGARMKSILALRKSDFLMDKDKLFTPRYDLIKLINYKSKRKYIQPLHKKVGEYFFYLLNKGEYGEDEHIIRAIDPKRRTGKPFSELSKDFLEICNEFINATPEMKKYYELIETDKSKIEHYDSIPHLGDFSDIIKDLKDRIKESKETIKRLKKEYLHIDNHENYLKNNFSAHNFRHMLSSIISEKSPLISSKLLDHSSDKINVNPQTYDYIKIPLNQVEVVMELTLTPYLKFLDNKIEDIKYDFGYTDVNDVDNDFISDFYLQSEYEKEFDLNNKIEENKTEINNEELIFEISKDETLTETERAIKIQDIMFGKVK